MDCIGIYIGVVTAASAAFVIAVCCLMAIFGPFAWAAVGIISSILGAVLTVASAISGFFLLIGWILSWFEGSETSVNLSAA